MILWAITACAMTGFVLGMQCRLVCLIMTSAMLAVFWPLLPLTDSGLMILALLAILQTCFLIGAAVGLRLPRSPHPVLRLGALVDTPPPCPGDGAHSDGHQRLIR